MATDLIIGGASGYDWNKLKYWVNSIKATGFSGDIVLVATNIKEETVRTLVDNGVQIVLYGQRQSNGDVINTSKGAPHVERFFYIWNFLDSNQDKYRFVTITDTRDVIFQRDPTEFLTKHMAVKSIVCSSEGIHYKDEPWGSENLRQTFGDFFYEKNKNWMIYNVGTIAGYFEDVKDFINILFQMSINRPIPIVDQAVFNYLINLVPFTDNILKTNNKNDWAIQLACTLGAVEARSGDIGAAGNIQKYLQDYKDIQPTINGATVTNDTGSQYCIVHQWDRIPALKLEIEKKYGTN